MIRTIIVIVAICLYILVIGLPFLILAWLTGNTDSLYQVGVRGARMGLWLARVEVEVHGREKIPTGRAAVFMPNHQSNVDPPAIVTVLPPVLVMVKKEFFRVPILGAGMTARGFIPVDRRNRERAIAAVDRAVVKLQQGYSFLGYPEGTRSPDGRLQAFKKGLFIMAIKARALIIPVSVSGATRIMLKGKPVIHPGRIRITIHDPIEAGKYPLEKRDELARRTRQAIMQGLTPDERPLSSEEIVPD